ncbi:OpgC domain-containing protein [Acidovorax sp. Leaf160]|uniref:OpgC domain-containing protein n=1 Tax=Acidovorax sp. Leaf160 TaxID=1736280 RepID=UPI0009E675AA|nr:OpgC domain-containing protein [Acidovorax sp. Leaf160]
MPPPSSSQRRWEIDFVRGLMLGLMTVTHLPTRVSIPLGQPFGFVSAAEGFVLLSAYMAGLVYGRVAFRKGIAPMRQAFWRRALTIYGCQAATLLFLFTVITTVGLYVDQPAVKGLLNFYFAQPVDALVGGLLLVYEPPLLDILPLYVLFMLISPWVLAFALQRSWLPVMAVSVLLWVLSQFGFAEWAWSQFSRILPVSVPFSETGSFVMGAWQFLWIMGLWMGASRNDPAAAPFEFPRWTLWLAGAIALVGLVWRHAVGQVPFPHAPWANVLQDKWLLAPLRLIDLFALVVLAIRFGPPLLARLPRMRWLETLGSASLAVFCAHLVVVLLVLTLFGANYERPWPLDIALLAACFGSLYAAAKVTLWFDRQPAEDDAPAPPPVVYAEKPTPLTEDTDLLPHQPDTVVAPAIRPL